jgi:hypothetical protein
VEESVYVEVVEVYKVYPSLREAEGGAAHEEGAEARGEQLGEGDRHVVVQNQRATVLAHLR